MSMTNFVPLELLRFLPLIAVMGYAAYKDYRTGEVSNGLWRYIIYGFALTVVEVAVTHNLSLLLFDISIMVVCVVFGFASFWLGSGGADAKAIMVLGFSAPVVPVWSWLYPLPLPFIVLLLASAMSLPFFIKKTNTPMMKRKIKFLPFMFIGLLVSVIP